MCPDPSSGAPGGTLRRFEAAEAIEALIRVAIYLSPAAVQLDYLKLAGRR